MWWFFFGLITGGLAMRLIDWVQAGKLSVGWYAWPLFAITIALLALTAQHFFASFKELEPRAAWMGLLFMGLPAFVLAGIVFYMFLPV